MRDTVEPVVVDRYSRTYTVLPTRQKYNSGGYLTVIRKCFYVWTNLIREYGGVNCSKIRFRQKCSSSTVLKKL